MENKTTSSHLEGVIPDSKGWGAIAATFWGALAFLAPQILLAFLIELAKSLNLHLKIDGNLINFAVDLIAESLTFLIALFVIRSYRFNLKSIGFGEFKKWFVIKALMFFPFYYVLTTIFLSFISPLLGINLEESQDVGFNNPHGFSLVLAFLLLVIFTPIVEETLFRGFLFRAYRRQFGFVLGSVFVSVLFGAAHAQANVGIDVFVLSLFSCYLREKTKSLWPSIMLHGFKNLVAFVFLFIIGMK